MSRNEMHHDLYPDKVLVRGAYRESQEKQVRMVSTGDEAPLYAVIKQPDDAGLEAHHPDLPMVSDKWDDDMSQRASWRTFSSSHKHLLWALAITIAVLLIVGAVVGGVLGSRHHHNNAPSASSSGNGSTPLTGPAYKAIRQDSQLAAVAFNDTSGTTQYRVYFQDSANLIKESSWNSTSQRWFVSNRNVTKAKPSTPIAAAAVGPGNMNASNTAGVYSLAAQEQYINLFFLDEKSRINELYTTSNDSRHWSSGTLTARNFVATQTSALTALWHADSTCTGCPNTLLLVYEDQNGHAQLVNGTQSGWSFYPLSMTLGPQSGLSLVMMRNSGFINPLRLYYQLQAGYLVSHDWESPEEIPYLNSKIRCNIVAPTHVNYEANQLPAQFPLIIILTLTAGKIVSPST